MTRPSVHAVVLLLAAGTLVASPRLDCSVSWIGNSQPGAKAHVPQDIEGIWVTSDGTVFSNVHWEEGGGNATAFKNGQALGSAGHTHGWGHQGGYAVAANSKHLFIAGRMNNEGGNLKDPATWPPKGFDWIGISRRPINDIRKAAPFAGAKGGKGGTLKEAFLVVDEMPVEPKSPGDRLRHITALSTTEDRLFVACPYDNTIKVYDADSMARVAVWSVDKPQAMVRDGSGEFWILQGPDAAAGLKLVRLGPEGRPLPHSITFESGMRPVALCIDARGALLVADDGPRQQIAAYAKPRTDRRPTRWIGREGGIYSGRAGEFADLKFNRPFAIGCDAANNLFVAHHGSTGGGSTILESYSPALKLNWRLFGLNFVDMADVDPANDADLYTKEERFRMDYSRPRGQDWTYAAYTVNRFAYPQDPRLHIWSAGAWVRRIRGNPFLFVNDMNGQHLQVYRFDSNTAGEIAIPAGLFTGRRIEPKDGWPPSQPAQGEWIWVDSNGNGSFDPDEYHINRGRNAPSYQGWWADSAGDVWQASESQGIRRFRLADVSKSGVPQWNYERVEHFPMPADFKTVKRLRYDPATDVMYLGGTTAEHGNQHWKPMGPVLCRYDRWSRPDRQRAWCIVLPYARGSQGHSSCEPMGFDVAGDYVFVPYTGASKELGFTTGHIELFRTSNGAAVGHMEPPADIGEIGLQDIRECLRAHRRVDGEYLVFLEEDYKAKILMYRWRPPVAGQAATQ